ncbi:hypothetical protein [Roseofilum sp. Guam]|uniref:hypothetical protein n=1 Tax=Roseofilum sp. Guam TaxID=2821502 RepID=UPI001B068841|nr:hypothetical protein [Roseofilum sp. Guam]MBP0027685.1 hypothetical protein [Roseofilum sp. Guam]
MAASNKRQARVQARSAINKWALGFASIAWIPGSHYAMTGGDVTMVIQVGSIYDVDLDRTTAGAVFTTIAAPLIGSKVAHSVLDFVPIVGWAAKSAVAAGVTKAVGEAMIRYFEDCSTLPA